MHTVLASCRVRIATAVQFRPSAAAIVAQHLAFDRKATDALLPHREDSQVVAPVSPYSKDAACPPLEVRTAQFEKLFQKIPGTAPDLLHVRECDFMTFFGAPVKQANVTAVRAPSDRGTYPGGTLNPKLPNSFELTGALVSHFLPSGGQSGTYLDERNIGQSANPQAQVAIDYNAALANAVAGLAALPADWESKLSADFKGGCPNIEDMKALLQRDNSTTTERARQAQTAVQAPIKAPPSSPASG
jgi:hypothetical protein